MLERWVRYSLWVTAPLNLLMASAFAFPQSPIGVLLGFPPGHPLYTLLSGALVALFGLVYVALAMQPAINRGLLCCGAVGKVMAVVIGFYLGIRGELPALLALLISGDLLFAGFWLYYLGAAGRKST